MLAPRAIMRKWMPASPVPLDAGGPMCRSQIGETVDACQRTYGALGSLEVRLARSAAEVRAAQRLRYQVFFEEMSAIPSMSTYLRGRDEDVFDRLCEHLLVIDRAQAPSCHTGADHLSWPFRRQPAQPPIVGTYRFLRQDVAERHAGFYSQGEYQLRPLLEAKRHLRFLELGRSCVQPAYRTRRTIEALWHGLWTYIRATGVDVMIGCASFEGTEPGRHGLPLSFLHHTAPAPDEWRVRAHGDRWIDMNTLPVDRIDPKAALKALPPLLKGYLRLGAYVGDGAVVDHRFGTTDVFVILPVARIDPRYFARFGAPGETTARIASKS